MTVHVFDLGDVSPGNLFETDAQYSRQPPALLRTRSIATAHDGRYHPVVQRGRRDELRQAETPVRHPLPD
jgi:hypothetical protein